MKHVQIPVKEKGYQLVVQVLVIVYKRQMKGTNGKEKLKAN